METVAEILHRHKSWHSRRLANLKRPKRTGWRIEELTLVYYLDDQEQYCVELDRCNTSAQILDWLCQIRSKRWGTPRCLAGLLDAFDIISGGLQRNVCGFGVDGKFSMIKTARKQYAN